MYLVFLAIDDCILFSLENWILRDDSLQVIHLRHSVSILDDYQTISLLARCVSKADGINLARINPMHQLTSINPSREIFKSEEIEKAPG